jgi:F-type H+-transporting ATPase subunit epsilon
VGAFTLTVATPERLLVDEPASEASIPARNGYIGVLPGHAPLLSELGSGPLSWNSNGVSRMVVVMGGFVEVLGDRVRVLAEEARRKEEIDAAGAKQRLEEARQQITQPPVENPSIEDYDAALERMKRAQTEVDATSA